MLRRCCCCQTCLVIPLLSCWGGQVERWYIWVSYSHCMDLKAPYGTSILRIDRIPLVTKDLEIRQMIHHETREVWHSKFWRVKQFCSKVFGTYIVSLENGGRCSSRSSKSLARRWRQEIKWSYHGQGHAGSMISPLNFRDTECLFEPVYPWSCSFYRIGSILLYLGRHHLEPRLEKTEGLYISELDT